MPNMDNGIVDKDKNVYFLHIPETGGRALKEYVINPLFNQKSEIVVGKHDGWSDYIDDDTYIISILRDPVKHACGFYLHFINKEERSFNTKNIFLEYYRSTPKLYNFQSKYILDSNLFNFKTSQHYESPDKDINENLLQERIGRIDLLISQDFLENRVQEVSDILAEDLDLKRIKVVNVDKLKYKNGDSADLYNLLTDEEKKEIQDYNNIDYKIYSQLINKEGVEK
jgi:hypothetical protein